MLKMNQTKPFYSDTIEQALTDCQEAGYQTIYMPELIQRRIKTRKETKLWRDWQTSLSLRAIGRSKQGNPVVLYAHIPHYFCEPKNIITAKETGLINGAGLLPQAEFERLLAFEGKGVYVLDYETEKKSSSGVINLDSALQHPVTIPFLGVSEIEAQKYLQKHRQVYGDKIGIWHCDDLGDQPRGRLLFLGNGYNNSLNGSTSLSNGRFLGVRASGSELRVAPAGRSAKKIAPHSLEEVLDSLKDLIAPALLPRAEQRLRRFYKH